MHTGIIAHRGGTKRGIENTLHAFKTAVSDGCHGIELDVRLTADEEPVVVHDCNLKRLTGISRDVPGTRFRDVRKLTVLGTTETIPHLREVLGFVAEHDIECFIELKESSLRLAEKVVAAINDYGLRGRAWVMGFTKRRQSLHYIKQLDPRMRTNVITVLPFNLSRTAALFCADAVSFGYSAQAGSYSLFRVMCACVNLTRAVESAQSREILVSVGIVNDPANIVRVVRLGVNAIFTDDVPTVRQTLLTIQ